MPRIKTTTPSEAQGVIKQGYDMFIKNIGMIPKPMEMMSVSPALFENQLKRIEYFSKHPNLSFPLLAHIRFLVAHHLDYNFCSDFNRMTLKKLGLDDTQIEEMTKDPATSLLEDKEKAMLEFVIQSIKAPASITDGQIENLKNLGWTDADMMDALAQGVGMIDHSIMMQVFQIDQNCLI